MNSNQRLSFYKYQGTGNDFVLIDNRTEFFPKNDTKLVKYLCDRRFGIGADGLILLENDNTSDFKMVYYNSDGKPSTMCGNGGRCIVAFAKQLAIIGSKTVFNAIDGLHHAIIEDEVVTLQMIDVQEVVSREKHFFVNTGSPHHVQLVSELDTLKVQQEGAKIRYGIYGEEGSNINFVSQLDDKTFKIRTYERGVEGETLSCGTGVTAVALAMHYDNKIKDNKVSIITKGGRLSVTFDEEKGNYTNVQLRGPATMVFKGEIGC